MAEGGVKKSLLQKLWDRRFFQYLATYLGVSWGLIQFLEWMVNRYDLNSSWVDNLVIFLFVMLPGMATFIYLHGKPGHDAWKPFEKFLYPINFALALVASFFIYEGNATQSTRQIEVTNFQGDTILRTVPEQSVTAKMVFFPISNSVEGEDWLKIGLPYLMDIDLEQDMKWYSIHPFSLKEDFLDLGYQLEEDISFSDKLKIATDHYGDFFIDGSLRKNNGQFEVEVIVYNTTKGSEEKSTTLSSESIFDLSDQITSFIRENFNNIQLDIAEENIDLPSRDLISNDFEAFKSLIIGMAAFNKGPDHYPEAFARIDKSIELDPNCAECYYRKVVMDQLRGNQGIESIDKAIKASRTLPERQRFRINHLGYIINKEAIKGLKLLDSWKKLYPRDITPYQALINYYSTIFQFSKAREIAEEAVNNGHRGNVILEAARLNIRSKDFQRAETYIDKYKELYPKKAKSVPLLAEIYIAKGQFDPAIDIYEEQSILNPSIFTNQLKLAECHYKKNDFVRAEKYYEEALDVANTPNDSLQILQDRMTYFIRYGRVSEYEKDRLLHRQIFESVNPKEAYLQVLLSSGGVYAAINDQVKYNALIEDIKTITPPFAEPVISTILDYVRSLWFEDSEAFPEAYEKAKPLMLQTATENALLSSEAMKNYFEGNYDVALELFHQFEVVAGTSVLDNSEILSNCYIKSDKIDDGIEYINNLLISDPYHPIGMVSKAALLHAKGGRKAEVEKILALIDELFENAHPDWRYLKKANDIKLTLESI